MAGNVGDLSFANAVIKLVGGTIVKQYEETASLHNRLQKGEGKKIGDRGIEIPTHVQPNANHTWMPDGGEFPVGGANKVIQAKVFFKNFGGAVRLTGAAMDSINGGDVGYIKSWKDFNLKETVGALYKKLNVYAHGTGTGRLATISTGASSATQTVSNNDKNRFLSAGLKVQFVIPATGVVSGNGTIANPLASATTFTLEASGVSATGDYVVPYGGFNLAITGTKAMVDDTTNGPTVFQNINRNDYPGYRAFRVNANTAGLDVAHLRAATAAGILIAQGELNRDALEIWSHPAQITAYNMLGWKLRRFEGKSKSIDLGFTAYEYEGINWVEDVDADKDRIDIINFTTMKKYLAKEFGWDEKTGSIWRQVVGTNSYKDQYEAFWTGRFNYGCEKPNANAFIDGLTIPSGY